VNHARGCIDDDASLNGKGIRLGRRKDQNHGHDRNDTY
jgi:hypothetical protein